MTEQHRHNTVDEALGCDHCQNAYLANAPIRNPHTIELIATPPTQTPELNQKVGELETWWLGVATEEIERTVPKAIEYGSGDLREIGDQMSRVMGLAYLETEQAVELGIYFYLVGKLARWSDAIRNGRRVSDDTLFDIGVYVRMAQRNRAVGGWPGLGEES